METLKKGDKVSILGTVRSVEPEVVWVRLEDDSEIYFDPEFVYPASQPKVIRDLQVETLEQHSEILQLKEQLASARAIIEAFDKVNK